MLTQKHRVVGIVVPGFGRKYRRRAGGRRIGAGRPAGAADPAAAVDRRGVPVVLAQRAGRRILLQVAEPIPQTVLRGAEPRVCGPITRRQWAWLRQQGDIEPIRRFAGNRPIYAIGPMGEADRGVHCSGKVWDSRGEYRDARVACGLPQ